MILLKGLNALDRSRQRTAFDEIVTTPIGAHIVQQLLGPAIRFPKITMLCSLYRNLVFAVIAFVTVHVCAIAQATPEVGIHLTADADCVVAIDNHFVSRVRKAENQLLPVEPGRHTLSAATQSGDYFEQPISVISAPNQVVNISFENARAEKVALEKKISALRREVSDGQTQLARRRSIVDAVNYYTDRWGKELGMGGSRASAAQNLNDQVEEQYWKNLGNPNQTAQGVGNVVMLAEIWKADRLQKKAVKNGAAVRAASARMQYLAKALEHPEQYPPDTAKDGYLAVVQAVKRGKYEGKLLTAPDRVSYSDSSLTFDISCAGLRNVGGGGKKLHMSFRNDSRHGTLAIKPSSDDVNPNSILGNIYLACPDLTK